MKEAVEKLPDLPIFTPRMKHSDRVDFSNSSEFQKVMEEAFAKSDFGMIVDMSEIKAMKGQGLRVLLSLSREAKRKHKDFYITNLSEHDTNYVETTGFVEIFNILELKK